MSEETEVQAGGQIPNTPTEAEASLLGSPGDVPQQGGEQPKVEGVEGKAEGQTEEAAKAPEVPETYEFKLPDGIDLDQEAVEQFTPLAKELGLSQDNAQKMVDLYAAQVQKLHQAQLESWKQTQQDWMAEVKADKEIGGPAFELSVHHGKQSIAKYFPDPAEAQAFRDLLNATGMGNNPLMVKLLARVGKSNAEDTVVVGGKDTAPVDMAKVFFPSMN